MCVWVTVGVQKRRRGECWQYGSPLDLLANERFSTEPACTHSCMHGCCVCWCVGVFVCWFVGVCRLLTARQDSRWPGYGRESERWGWWWLSGWQRYLQALQTKLTANKVASSWPGCLRPPSRLSARPLAAPLNHSSVNLFIIHKL